MRASPPMNGILVVAGGTYSFIAIVLPLSLPLPPSQPLHSSSVGKLWEPRQVAAQFSRGRSPGRSFFRVRSCLWSSAHSSSLNSSGVITCVSLVNFRYKISQD